MAVQRRLGILSQRWPGSYSLNRVTGRFIALKIPGDSRSVAFLTPRVARYVFSANGALLRSAWGNAPGINRQEDLSAESAYHERHASRLQRSPVISIQFPGAMPQA